jgi:hypothetical protein
VLKHHWTQSEIWIFKEYQFERMPAWSAYMSLSGTAYGRPVFLFDEVLIKKLDTVLEDVNKL